MIELPNKSQVFQMLTHLADSMSMAVFISLINSENNHQPIFIYANNAFYNTIKLNSNKCINKNIFEVLNILNEVAEQKLRDLLDKENKNEKIDLFISTGLAEKKWITFSIKSFLENEIKFNIWTQEFYNSSPDFQHNNLNINTALQNINLKIEDGPDPICFVDFKGKLIYANRILLRLLDYSFEELLSIGILNVHEKQFIDPVIESFYATRQGVHQQYEVALIAKSGDLFDFTVTSFPFIIENEIAGVYYYGKDITEAQIFKSAEILANDITSILNKENSLLKKMNNVLELLSHRTGYECIECWFPDKLYIRNNLFASHYPNEPGFEEFKAISHTLQLDLNEDDLLLTRKGHEISRKVTNLFLSDNFPRKNWAEKLGLIEGFSFPIYYQNKLVACFTFFSRKKTINFNKILQIIKITTNRISIHIEYLKQKDELNQIFNLSPDILCLLDISGRFIKVNQTFLNSFEPDLSEINSNQFYQFVSENDYNFIINQFIKLKKEKLIRFECQFFNPLKPSNKLWLEWSFSLNLEEGIIYCAAKDISQSVIYDLKLKESKDRYLLLSKATNDVMYEWDVENDQIFWNESFTKVFGHFIPNSISNYDFWSSFLHPLDEDRVKRNFKSVKIKSETSLVNEYRYRTSNGEYKNILDRGTLIYNEENKLVKMLGIMQDITALKESESTLEQLNIALQQRARQLQELNKELEQFAYIVSHDLQEPLRMISSFMQLLLSENVAERSEKSELYISFAIDGANRMKRLIQDLLTYSRVGATEEDFLEIDCNVVIKETLQVYNQRIIDLKAEVKVNKLPKIRAIHSLIGQVFDNMISNSLKYNDKPIPKIEVLWEENNTHFILMFKDNGIGVDPRYIDIISLPFKRLHNVNEYSGTGIGLAVVKKIAEKHNGLLWLESEPKIGSTFFVSFKK